MQFTDVFFARISKDLAKAPTDKLANATKALMLLYSGLILLTRKHPEVDMKKAVSDLSNQSAAQHRANIWKYSKFSTVDGIVRHININCSFVTGDKGNL